MNENAAIYWRSRLHRIKVETESLHAAIDAGQRQKSFEIIQLIEGTLISLRSSLRENMDEEHKKAPPPPASASPATPSNS